ncbi:MAG TPA: right-handed parallel beta-helix repeat-containing protein [Thermoanaerobaculia bacterium]|jgi:hypothetical protein|nr:right-handed parallel beta-helix repeat-containing protein [Thermoanaerobaculia bacterium]
MRTVLTLVLFALTPTLFAAEPETRLIRVQSTADSGDGTFRNAILEANANCGPGIHCEIGFDLPTGSTFQPLTPLPAITACGSLLIDGGNIFRDVDRPYELSGVRITEGKGSGLEYRPVCVDPAHLNVNGLAINSFPDDGITLMPSDTNPVQHSDVRLEGVFIGTDRTGRMARPNGLRGITSHMTSVVLSVTRAILSGNGRSGLFLSNVAYARVYGCLIGTAADGLPLGNGAAGIFLHHGSLSADRNVIAYNSDFGIALARGASAAIESENSIHSNEFVGIDWGLDGPTRETREELGIPNAPMMSNAIYDAETNTTIVYGTLAIEKVLGQRYAIRLFSNRTANERGEWEGETTYPSSSMDLFPSAPGVYAWEVRHRGDLRGEVVTTTVGVAQFSDFPIRISSEFSSAIAVH